MEMFQLEFMRTALISGGLIGLVCSSLGVLVVLRRIIFVAMALAEMSALGVATAIYFDKDPVLFSFIFTMLGVLIFAPEYGGKRIPQSALIGIVFGGAWALSILILSKAPHGEAGMLNLVQGNILGATGEDITLLINAFVPITVIFVLFYKFFLFVSFDGETAGTTGIKSSFWNLLFYILLGATISISIKVAGVLLTFAFLVLPASISLMFAGSMRGAFAGSVLMALLSSFIGLVVSFKADLPTGPAVVGIGVLLFGLLSGISHLLSHFPFILPSWSSSRSKSV